MEKKEKVTREESRTHLEQFNLACELVKVIRRFFPGLLSALKSVKDPRHQSYITYGSHVLLMTRILAAIFYISSMRKASEELNDSNAAANIKFICGEPELKELPYWETINNYLVRLDPDELQKVVYQLVKQLIRSRAFENGRLRGRHWGIIIDGTQLESSREELDPQCMRRTHRKGKEDEYTEYYYYVMEAKLYLMKEIQVSILTEFVENTGTEIGKQDCERNAAYRMMERLKKEFPMLPVCLMGDSLYACAPFFKRCRENGWKFLVRYKKGSIPSVYEEYEAIRKIEKTCRKETNEEGEVWYDFASGIEYGGLEVNVAEYKIEKRKEKEGEKGKKEKKETDFMFITDLPVDKKNVRQTIADGRERWRIENEGFNTQKKHGYYLEHMFSRDYQGMKNHYYLIQIGHMIAQIIEAWGKLWGKTRMSREQKHRRMLEAWKFKRLEEEKEYLERPFQIRLGFEFE